MTAWAADLYQTSKWEPTQAQMEQVCRRTGNYANHVHYSKSYTTPEQIVIAWVILNKLYSIYLTDESNILNVLYTQIK